jgi:hypothetical protein
MKLIIPVDKKKFFEENKPTTIKYDKKVKCIHCGEMINTKDYKVQKEGKNLFIVCPNAPKCDGTIIDWW